MQNISHLPGADINAATTTIADKPRRRTGNGRNPDLVALLREFQQRLKEGHVPLFGIHPIVGSEYQRLGTVALNDFMLDAQIMVEDAFFTSFTLVLGTHGPDESPFVCIRNRVEDGLHLLIGGNV